MRHIKKLLLLLVVTASMTMFTNEAKSTHIMGSDMTWDCIGQDSFMITLTLYRDCNGIPMDNIARVTVKCVTTSQTLQTMSIPKPPPVDITPTCDNSCTRCESRGCSFPYGIEKYTYQQLLVISNAGTCCKISLSWTSCCRNTTITTGMASGSFWCEAMLDRCQTPCDNSPRFTNPPVAIICIGQDFTFNHGVTDFDIGGQGGLLDSLGYEWVYPRGNGGSNLSYSGQYDYNEPIFYWGFGNPNLPLPRGFHLDPYTGDIGFRPMKVEQTVLAMKVTEYRNGVKIGEITRDMQIIVISCPNNQAPLLSGPFYKEVCAGSTVTFNIRTMDYDPNDTLTVGWNASIPGAIWSDNNGQAKHPTGVLTWTPSEQHASNIPYVFTVTVKDDACPVNGSSTRAYQILVKPLPRARITVVDSGCGDYYMYAQPLVGAAPSYQWIGNFSPGFQYVGSAIHYKFNGPGRYPYTMSMTAGTGTLTCSRTYFDTIEVDTFLTLAPLDNVDVCYGDSVMFRANYSYNTGDVSFKWNDDPTDTFQEKRFISTSDTLMWVTVRDTMGCRSTDSVRVNMHNHPVVDVGPDLTLCSYGSEVVTANITYDESMQDSLVWSSKRTGMPLLNDVTSLTVNDSDTYLFVVKDTLGCIGRDSLRVEVNPEVISQAPGVTICFGDTAELNAIPTGSKTNNVLYRWYNGSVLAATGQRVYLRPTATTDYMLKVTERINGVECRDSSMVRVRVNPLPDIVISTIPERCIDGNVLRLNDYVTTDPISASKQWSTPGHGLTTGDLFMPIAAGVGSHKVVIKATNLTTGCINYDSSQVTINKLPDVNAGDDDTMCTGDLRYDLNGQPSIPLGDWRNLNHPNKGVTPGTSWYFDATQSNITGDHSLIYHYTDGNGCENEDTMLLTVFQTPNVVPGSYDDLCIDDGAISLSGQPAGGKWSGNGVFGSQFNPGAAGVGSHELTYTVKNGVCEVSEKVTVTVNPLPTIVVRTKDGETTYCSNDGWIELEGLPTGGTWSGQYVAGSFFNTGETTSAETSYDLVYTYKDGNGCENSATLTVTVRPAPSVTIDPNANKLCYPEQYNVSATYSFADGVMWFKDNDSASGNFSGNPNNTDVGYNPGPADLARLYFVLYIQTTHNDNVCAPAYDTIKPKMSAIPVADFDGFPPTGCTPHTVDFADSSTITLGKITKWDWIFGDGGNSTDQNPSHEYTSAGSYTVSLKVTSDAGCEHSVSKGGFIARVVPDAGFIPEPELALISSPTILFNNYTKNETPGIVYSWDFGDGNGESNERDPEYKFRDTGSYNVLLTATNEWGCEDTSVREIVILPDIVAFIPNAFRPGGGAVKEENEVFRAVVDGVTEFDMKIYNRWGDLMYESTDYLTHGWAGTYLNSTEAAPMGVYVYILKVKGMDGADYKYSGTITLLR
jgi:PKD repeat protein